jgi:hypothetical protein
LFDFLIKPEILKGAVYVILRAGIGNAYKIFLNLLNEK